MVFVTQRKRPVNKVLSNLEKKLPTLILGSSDDPLDHFVSPDWQRKKYRIEKFKERNPADYHRQLNDLFLSIRQFDDATEKAFKQTRRF